MKCLSAVKEPFELAIQAAVHLVLMVQRDRGLELARCVSANTHSKLFDRATKALVLHRCRLSTTPRCEGILEWCRTAAPRFHVLDEDVLHHFPPAAQVRHNGGTHRHAYPELPVSCQSPEGLR